MSNASVSDGTSDGGCIFVVVELVVAEEGIQDGRVEGIDGVCDVGATLEEEIEMMSCMSGTTGSGRTPSSSSFDDDDRGNSTEIR